MQAAARRGVGGYPLVIQGGMGVGISDWRLAQAVSRCGQLGVVSGTALDVILVRRLQTGDPGGHVRRALRRLPFPRMAAAILDRYFIEGGKPDDRPYVALPLHAVPDARELVELCIAGNFVEVTLAREGHDNAVGINYLEKIQLPHLPSLYGAMLAGVGYVLMGAGIPSRIPGAIDRLARHEPATYPLHVTGAAPGNEHLVTFDPRDFLESDLPALHRPRFLPIVSSHVLAMTLLRRSNGRVDGFVVEGPTAGGHNAPPRGRLQLDAEGQPVYGTRDLVDFEVMRSLDVPFWLAGGYGDPGRLCEALDEGAAGVQVGTAFAFCVESGMRPDCRRALLEQACDGKARVFTDPLASPTSFPLKVAELAGSLSEARVYESRTRVCDLGYLREAYLTADGAVGFRCAAEPVSVYVAKGGNAADTAGRKCVCNGLIATMGHPQVRGRQVEPPLITAGDALAGISQFLPPGGKSYTAADVIARVLGRV